MINRTTAPASYVSPSPAEIKAAATHVGLERYSPALVQDIANIAAGGDVLPPSALRDAVTAEIHPSHHEQHLEYHQNISDFLKHVKIDDAPGETPLGKAVSTLKVLAQQEGGEPNSSTVALEGGEPWIPVFLNGESGVQTTRHLNSILESIETMDGLDKELMRQQQDAADDISESEDMSEVDMENLHMLEEMMRKDLISRFEMARNLSQLSKMHTKRQRAFEPDPQGTERRVRPVRGFNEFGKLPASEWALPSQLRNMRVATHVPHVSERGRAVERKQLLYLMVDCSGSMYTPARINSACGIIMNRLKAVCSGDAELFFTFFDDTCKEEYEATDEPSALDLMKRVGGSEYFGRESGGDTDIAACAKTVAVRIEKKLQANPNLVRPEMVIITDGGDDVSDMKRKDFGSTVVHAFIISYRNDELAAFARSTGGTAIQNL